MGWGLGKHATIRVTALSVLHRQQSISWSQGAHNESPDIKMYYQGLAKFQIDTWTTVVETVAAADLCNFDWGGSSLQLRLPESCTCTRLD